jgi:hypothetical protein
MFISINECERQCTEMTGRGRGGLNCVWEDNIIINHKEILWGCELDVCGLGYYVVAGSYLTYLVHGADFFFSSFN